MLFLGEAVRKQNLYIHTNFGTNHTAVGIAMKTLVSKRPYLKIKLFI